MTFKEFEVPKREGEKSKKAWVETPLRESYALSQAAGCRVFLKLENLQPSGSFKSRGIGHYIQCRLQDLASSPSPSSEKPQPHIFSSSGGNAGLAAVHASRTFGLPCTVVVPLSTKPLMIAKLKAAGAHEVIQRGETWQDADAFLRNEVMKKAGPSAIYAPPFDHPDVWTGHSTLIPEILSQLPDDSPPDVIICSVGGGGLFNGIMQGLDTWLPVFYPDRYSRKNGNEANDTDMSTPSNGTTHGSPSPSPSPYPYPTVLAVETHGAHSLAASLSARTLISLPTITSAATSLGARRVTPQTLEYALRSHVKSVVLSDAEAARACWRLADDERLMVELACGVNVALCYDVGRLEGALGRKVRREDKVVVVLCGGSAVTVEMLEGWRREFGKEIVGVDGLVGDGVRNGEAVPSEVTMP
ncbi:tryptophan synthase beta subunit-like PLP-dependent enzyme [Westerdykella ornata]|uniref:L-serine ammonia-lyase n=1 Tax=Westerdykella ornata TaxID=318751 RepID=A0A6A6JWR3_WESOR|nr:tryptophan synthase beta subunit-like PLP-dependent enzyme [Westerdykella ornata]KAF2281051.1 tryptophan synthase beta subunit-like PLP-dependent enzyme [Westerdykella ornata]